MEIEVLIHKWEQEKHYDVKKNWRLNERAFQIIPLFMKQLKRHGTD